MRQIAMVISIACSHKGHNSGCFEVILRGIGLKIVITVIGTGTFYRKDI